MNIIIVNQDDCYLDYRMPNKDKYKECYQIYKLLLHNNKKLKKKYSSKFSLSISEQDDQLIAQFCQLVKKNVEYETLLYYEDINDLNSTSVNYYISIMNAKITEYFNSTLVSMIPCKFVVCSSLVMEAISFSLQNLLRKREITLSNKMIMKKKDGSSYDFLCQPDLYQSNDMLSSSTLLTTRSTIGTIMIFTNPSTASNPLNDILEFKLICTYKEKLFKIEKSFHMNDIESNLAIGVIGNTRSILLNLKGAKIC